MNIMDIRFILISLYFESALIKYFYHDHMRIYYCKLNSRKKV